MCTRMYGEVSQPWGRMERRETRARPSDGAREHKQYVRVLLAGQAHRRAPRRAVADVEEAVNNEILAQRLVEL